MRMQIAMNPGRNAFKHYGKNYFCMDMTLWQMWFKKLQPSPPPPKNDLETLTVQSVVRCFSTLLFPFLLQLHVTVLQRWVEFSRGSWKKLMAPYPAPLCRNPMMKFLAVTVLPLLIVSTHPLRIIFLVSVWGCISGYTHSRFLEFSSVSIGLYLPLSCLSKQT